MGRLVYLSLDWGLETQVERELSETLEILVCHMTKVNLNTDHSCQPICTISDVIQVLRSLPQNHPSTAFTESGAVTEAEYAFGCESVLQVRVCVDCVSGRFVRNACTIRAKLLSITRTCVPVCSRAPLSCVIICSSFNSPGR